MSSLLVWDLREEHETERRRAVERARMLLGAARHGVAVDLRRSERLLTSAARTFLSRADGADAAGAFLRSALPALDEHAAYAVTRADGSLVSATGPLADGPAPGARDAMRAVLDNVAREHLGLSRCGVLVCLSRAVRDDSGRLHGVVVLALGTERLRPLVSILLEYQDATWGLYRADGTPIVALPRASDPALHRSIVARHVGAGDSSSSAWLRGTDGESRLAAAVTLSRHEAPIAEDLVLVLTRRTDALLAAQYRHSARFTTASGALIVLGVGFVWLNYRSETRHARTRDFAAAVLENTSALVVGVDATGRVCQLNRAAAAMAHTTGRPGGGERFVDVFAPADAADVPAIERWLVGASGGARETTVRGTPPRVVAWQAVDVASTDGCGARVCIGQDVTDARRIQEQLSESEARYKGILDSAMDAIVVADEDGRVLFFNGAAESVFGRDRDQVVGHSLACLMPERFRHEHHGHMARFTASGATPRRMGRPGNIFGLHADGREFPIEASISRTQTGERVYLTAIMRDVTERRLSEGRLRDALDEKHVLLKEVYHRVKNNLQVISSLLRLQSASVPEERVRALFDDAAGRVRSMALVHEQLYRSADLAQVDFHEYLTKLVAELEAAMPPRARPVRLQLEAVAVSLPVEAAIPCGLIVNELVSNALRHAFPSGGPGVVRVCFDGDPQGLHLSVADDGVGLPEGFSLDGPSRTLGLDLVRALTRQLAGRMVVERTQGARFDLTFPMPRREPAMDLHPS